MARLSIWCVKIQSDKNISGKTGEIRMKYGVNSECTHVVHIDFSNIPKLKH